MAERPVTVAVRTSLASRPHCSQPGQVVGSARAAQTSTEATALPGLWADPLSDLCVLDGRCGREAARMLEARSTSAAALRLHRRAARVFASTAAPRASSPRRLFLPIHGPARAAGPEPAWRSFSHAAVMRQEEVPRTRTRPHAAGPGHSSMSPTTSHDARPWSVRAPARRVRPRRAAPLLESRGPRGRRSVTHHSSSEQ
jgi:hypothetical protein